MKVGDFIERLKLSYLVGGGAGVRLSFCVFGKRGFLLIYKDSKVGDYFFYF